MSRDRDQSENERRERLRARWRKANHTPEAKASRKKYERSPRGKFVIWASRLQKKFGLTPDQYNKMFLLQGGKCVRCGHPPKTRKLAVEHDHATGRVRGLACYRCNKYVIGKNTLETAKWLVEYLGSDFDGRNL